jgi:hypothetical protein
VLVLDAVVIDVSVRANTYRRSLDARTFLKPR